MYIINYFVMNVGARRASIHVLRAQRVNMLYQCTCEKLMHNCRCCSVVHLLCCLQTADKQIEATLMKMVVSFLNH